jgi:hypothetical protein
LGQSQQALLDYYTHLRVKPINDVNKPYCDLLLIQEENNHGNIKPSDGWHLIWQGKRPADRHEQFRLYQYNNVDNTHS